MPSVSHITSIRVLVIFLFYDLHLFRHYIAFVILIVINVKWISALICLVFLMQGCCFITMKLLRTAITQLINKRFSQQFFMSSHKLLLTNELAKIFQIKYKKNVFVKQTAERCWTLLTLSLVFMKTKYKIMSRCFEIVFPCNL